MRNISLDKLKVLLSILVITIHFPVFYSERVTVINYITSNGISRIAVPIFFIINGYYLEGTILKGIKAIINYLKRFVFLYLVWMVVYLPFYFPDTPKHLIQTILIGYFHLWYLPAVMGASIVLFGIEYLPILKNRILLLSLVLFLVGWALQQNIFIALIHDLSAYDFLYRNFFFMAFPFMGIGLWINRTKSIQHFFSSLTNKQCVALIIVLISLISIESLYYYHLNPSYNKDFLLTTLLFSPFVFLLFNTKGKKVIASDFSAKFSSAIYFAHPLVIFFIQKYLPPYYNEFCFPLICLGAFVLGYFVVRINKKIPIFI